MIYDVHTKNYSFLKISKELKDKNIRNNKFMLELINPALVGVDPHSDSLTQEEKAAIYLECSVNYWYFIREVVRLADTGNPKGSMFMLSLGNLAASFINLKNINSMLILPRQQGKTVGQVVFSVWVQLFEGYFTKETYLHKSHSGAIDNLSRFKMIKELLPEWLVAMVTSGNDKDNLETKYFDLRKNTIVALSSANSVEGAEKLGRGSSTPLVYFDEFAFLERNKLIYDALVPAWKKSAMRAQANGAHFGIHMTTTPNTLILDQARYCYDKIIKEACNFQLEMYDMEDEELLDFVSKNSDNDFVFIYYSWRELGVPESWYTDQLRATDPLNVARELDCIWPEAVEGMLFNQEVLQPIKHYLKPIQFTLTIDGYVIHFYDKPDFSANYILSCDVAGGLGLDSSVILVIDPSTFKIVGLFKNSRIGTDSFTKLIEKLMTVYLVNSILIIENNNYGLAIIDTLVKKYHIEARMYREEVAKQGEITLLNGRVQKAKTKKFVYGVHTGTTSRKLMMDILTVAVNEEPEVFVSEHLYDELRSLTVNPRTNKIEARSGAHDDIIMSYCIFRYALAYGKTLSTKFGIYKIPTSANLKRNGSYNAGITNFGNLIDIANNADTMSLPDNDNLNFLLMEEHRKMKEDDQYLQKYSKDDEEEERRIREQGRVNSSLFNTICGFNND